MIRRLLLTAAALGSAALAIEIASIYPTPTYISFGVSLYVLSIAVVAWLLGAFAMLLAFGLPLASS
jgi:hypothetical protein